MKLQDAAAGSTAVVCAWGLSAATHWDLHDAFTRPAVARLLSADAFLIEAALATIAMPVIGAAVPPQSRLRILHAVAAAVTISLTAAAIAAARSGYPVSSVLRSHVALTIVAAALAGLGTLLATVTRNRMDAAGAALAVSLFAATALLAGGPATADLSERTINAGLLVSPPVAIVAAADIDILRNDLFYRLSPVAHRRFSYPAWQLTVASYGIFAIGCLALVTLINHAQKGSIE